MRAVGQCGNESDGIDKSVIEKQVGWMLELSNYRRLRPQGFTLVELLVVIAIIAVLAAILFPVFATAKQSGQKASCLSNLKQIGAAINVYTGDWDDLLPNAAAWSVQWRDFPKADQGSCLRELDSTGKEIGVLRKYVKSAKVWFCPAFTMNSVLLEYGPYKITPRDNQTTYLWLSYSQPSRNQIYSHRLSEIPHPSKQTIVFELPYADPGAHNHVSNILFADNHVKSISTMQTDDHGGSAWTYYAEAGWK